MKSFAQKVLAVAVSLLCLVGLGHPLSACHPMLEAHTAEFEPQVIEVCEGVHVAVGYGLANSILIEGDDGVIVVDTLGAGENATPVKAEFDKIAKGRPTKAIIYTHNHPDHTFGARVFAGKDHPEVICHEQTLEKMAEYLGIIQPIHYYRGMHQFGSFLPEEYRVNCGIGKEQDFIKTKDLALLLPTRTFAGDRLELTVAGVHMELVHAPGETDDQIFIWLPEHKVLLPGDNFYKSFPNLYAIRGTSRRDVKGWVASLDKMRALQPEHLVPSHTKPLSGKTEIYGRLTNYRDAIQFVHDQTIAYMNQGLEPDVIVEKVKLPKHLAEDPFLQEFYGRVDWSVRGIYQGYLGWFSGKCKDLFPEAPSAKAQHLAELAGGADSLIEKAKDALANREYPWGLQLADAGLQIEEVRDSAREIKVACLKAMAKEIKSANGRNYLLTEALETEGKLEIPDVQREVVTEEILKSMPIDLVFENMKVKVNAKRAEALNRLVGIHFTDLGADYFLHLRNGVLEVQKMKAANPDVHLEVSSVDWKAMIAGLRDIKSLFAQPHHSIDGEVGDLQLFLSCFSGAS